MVDTLSVEKKKRGIEMCDKCNHQNNAHENIGKSRRVFLKASAILAATPVMTRVAWDAQASSQTKIGNGPYATIGYGATSATTPSEADEH
jgi:hypothetical protein